MATERTLCIIKPDVYKVKAVGEIISWLEEEEFEIVIARRMTLTKSQAEEFYKEHKGKEFFSGLVEFMTSGKIFVAVLEGENSIERYRQIMGNTDPKKASKETMRGFYGTELPHNAVHGSDSKKSAEREISLLFQSF